MIVYILGEIIVATAIVPIAGKFSEAIDFLTEAIMLNPKSAILYASRGNTQACELYGFSCEIIIVNDCINLIFI